MPNPTSGDDDERREFIAAMTTQIAHVLDRPGEFWNRYQVTSQPVIVLVAADGSYEVHPGATGPQELLTRAETLAQT